MDSFAFDDALRQMSTDGRLDIEKAKRTAASVKDEVVRHLVHLRQSVIAELVSSTEMDCWLSSMGYLHTTTDVVTRYTFRHTAEHRIIRDRLKTVQIGFRIPVDFDTPSEAIAEMRGVLIEGLRGLEIDAADNAWTLPPRKQAIIEALLTES